MIRYKQPVCGPLSTPPRWHLDGRTSPGGKPTAHRPVPRAEMSVAWNGRCRCWMERCWLEEEAPMLYPLACQTTMCPMQPAACESSQCLEGWCLETLFSFSVHIWHKCSVFNELKLSEEAHVSFCWTLYLKYKSVSLSSGKLCQLPVILGKQVLRWVSNESFYKTKNYPNEAKYQSKLGSCVHVASKWFSSAKDVISKGHEITKERERREAAEFNLIQLVLESSGWTQLQTLRNRQLSHISARCTKFCSSCF